MDNFEKLHLLCVSDESTSVLSPLRQLSLVPGPSPVLGTMSSTDLQSLAEYDIAHVRKALLTHPGMVDHGDLLLWCESDRCIELDFTLFDSPERSLWGGSNLSTRCFFADLLRLWRTISISCPATWLHNSDCTMYSPGTFVEEVALLSLQPALQSPDLELRDRAYRAKDLYENLVREFSS